MLPVNTLRHRDPRGRAYVELELQPVGGGGTDAPASPVRFLRVYHDDDVDAVHKRVEPDGGRTSPLREAIRDAVLDATRLELQFTAAERDASRRKPAEPAPTMALTRRDQPSRPQDALTVPATSPSRLLSGANKTSAATTAASISQQTFAEEKAKILQRELNSLRGEKLDKLRYYRSTSHTSLVPPGKEAAHRLAVMLQRRAYNLEEETRTLRDHVAAWRRRAVDAERQISALETKVRLQDSIYSAPTLTSSHMATLHRNNTVLQTRISELERELAQASEHTDKRADKSSYSLPDAASAPKTSAHRELEQARRDVARLEAALRKVTESRNRDISSAVRRALAVLPEQVAASPGQDRIGSMSAADPSPVTGSAADPAHSSISSPRTPDPRDRIGQPLGSIDAGADDALSPSYRRVQSLTPDREVFVLREELKRLLAESDLERAVHERDLNGLREELERARSDLQKHHWRRSER